jgi:hypothetical protein
VPSSGPHGVPAARSPQQTRPVPPRESDATSVIRARSPPPLWQCAPDVSDFSLAARWPCSSR